MARLAGHGGRDKRKLYDALCAAISTGSVLSEEVVIWGLTKFEAQTFEKVEIDRWPEEQLLNETKSERQIRITRQLEILHSDPTVIAKRKDNLARMHLSPKVRAKRAKTLKSSPKSKVHLVQLNANNLLDLDGQEKRRAHVARLNSDPEVISKRAATLRLTLRSRRKS